MLQRVISIKNVGRFKNCAAAGDVAFRRYTMIFAEKARGKTTVCDILGSLSRNSPDIIIGRTNTPKRGAARSSIADRLRRDPQRINGPPGADRTESDEAVRWRARCGDFADEQEDDDRETGLGIRAGPDGP